MTGAERRPGASAATPVAAGHSDGGRGSRAFQRPEDSQGSRALYRLAAEMYELAAEKVKLNPQPLPPLE